ncbi:MAG: hypothetical protein AUG89_12325 [Acidobacteria bacterium 13_1_20CM_4_56_7]|nr:MAG: hypothetical protein AUG89_12325 [Acidobacteria bacterium 13_1_20CM_4_56_7]
MTNRKDNYVLSCASILLDRFAKSIEANEGTSDADIQPTFIAVKYPNSGSTTPFGLNNGRAVVGTYTDSSGKQHGFLAKPNF